MGCGKSGQAASSLRLQLLPLPTTRQIRVARFYRLRRGVAVVKAGLEERRVKEEIIKMAAGLTGSRAG